MIVTLAIAAAVSLAAGTGKPGVTPGRLIAEPVWLERPAGADVATVYPDVTNVGRHGGHVIVACRVRADGRLSDCAILEETPKGAGFGAAVLQLAAKFRMAPKDRAGEPTAGGQVPIPVKFPPE